MTELFAPPTGGYDLRLIGLSVVLASFPAYLAFDLASRISTSRRPSQSFLYLLGSGFIGIAIILLGFVSISFAAAVTLGLTLGLAVIHSRLSAQALRLEESEQRYRELVESAQVAFWQRDLQSGHFTFVSQQAEELLGFPCHEWMEDANFWERHVLRQDRDLAVAHQKRTVASLSTEPIEHRMTASDGSVVWVRTAMRLVRKPSGGQELVGSMFDITKRKQTEEALEEERRLFAALMDASPECIYFKDPQSRFVRVNKAVANLFGLEDPDQALGKSDADFFASSYVSRALGDEHQIITTGEPLVDREERETWPDGRFSWISVTKMPLRNSRDEICGTIGVSRDITERKLAEESLRERTRELLKTNAELERQIAERRSLEGQLVQAQKLESIGQLAAGVAHEINTPIQYVGDNCRFFADSFSQIDTVLRQYAQLLEQAKQSELAFDLVSEIEETIETVDLPYLLDEIPRAIEQSTEGVERVAHIVRAMKEFSHPGLARMEAIDLNHAIKSTLMVCRNEWKYVADTVTRLDPELPPVRCLVGEINQVFLNVVVNAAHAIADLRLEAKGTITIATRQDGDMVEICVSDNGIGIPEAVQSRIFDPFFTTKEVGRGSGQGLAIARNVVVKKHGGTIVFRTAPGKGTEFTIRLPIAGVPLEDELDPSADLANQEMALA